jgi:uroporphyrinogen-III decarboxylase
MLSAKGTQLFSQDSDGNMEAVMETFIDSGVNIMLPAEPAAGMDIVALRKRYGTRMAFKGGIDKHVLRQDRAAIVKELEYKLQPLMRQGGMIFGLDHRIPNGTSLENYRFYIRTAKEILGLPQDSVSDWQPMAF